MKYALLVILVTLGILMTMGASSCSESLDKQNEIDNHPERWALVNVGDSMDEVASEMGEPSSKQSFDNSYEGHTECWYWGFSYQICFTNQGAVDSKNAY